jgi:hypothetical protein
VGRTGTPRTGRVQADERQLLFEHELVRPQPCTSNAHSREALTRPLAAWPPAPRVQSQLPLASTVGTALGKTDATGTCPGRPPTFGCLRVLWDSV